jgi:hypothetical protein
MSPCCELIQALYFDLCVSSLVLKKVKSLQFYKYRGAFMSKPADHSAHDAHAHDVPAVEEDSIDSIVPMMPIVLPLAGAVLMFLLAFIAVMMA